MLCPRRIFSDHEYKLREAVNNLPPVCTTFIYGVVMKNPSNQTQTVSFKVGKKKFKISIPVGTTGQYFDIKSQVVDSLARMDCLYVNWSEADQEWMKEISVPKEELQKAIGVLRYLLHIFTISVDPKVQ